MKKNLQKEVEKRKKKNNMIEIWEDIKGFENKYQVSNLGNVKYFSQNKTIYFNKNINLVNLDESILRECIHYLQDQTKIKELCKIEKSQVKGKALNEVGINYILNKLFNNKFIMSLYMKVRGK